MERVSEIILRNGEHFNAGDTLLFNPPPDGLFRELASGGRKVTVWTQDFGDYRWFRAQAAASDLIAEFGVLPEARVLPSQIILFQPREKDRLDMVLNFLAANLEAGACVWLVGENTSGIKSAGKHLEKYFTRVSKIDSARHCALFRGITPEQATSFDLASYQQKWLLGKPGADLRMVSLPGAFAHGRLDRGTELLLQAIEKQSGDWKADDAVLDFGCGIGVIGLSVLTRQPGARLTLLDSSALALESARLSLAANNLTAEVLPSDGLGELQGVYDWIISNPPFHRGVATDLNVARRFFTDAGGFLSKQGRILLVCNRHLPYESWLRESFNIVESIESNNGFKILHAARPKGR